MSNADAPGGPAGQADEELTVLVVGSEALADQLSGVDGAGITVRRLPADTGATAVADVPFDCLVVSGDCDPDWELLRDLEAPVVLYGGVDDLPDVSLHRDVDVVLERRPEGDTSLLLEKIRAVTGATTAPSTLSDAIETVTSAGGTAATFLVDADGQVRWSNVALAAYLPSAAGEHLPPESASLYDRLAAVFRSRDGTADGSPALADLAGSTAERDGTLLQLAVDDQGRYYRHYSYPLADDAEAAGEHGHGRGDRIEVLQDVTATVGNHDRLALFESLVENAQDGLFVLNADWQVEYLNRTYARMLGYEREQLLGTHVAQQLSPGEMRRAQAATERLIDGENDSAEIDITLQRGDGAEIDASVHFWPRRTDDGRYGGLMGAVRDITERKARERELERYEAIVQAVGDPVCTLDAEGQFVYVNDAFEERTGYDLDTLRGKPVSVVIGAEAAEAGESLVRELLADSGRTTGTFELQLPAREGGTIPTECQIALLPADGGAYQGAVAVMRDITRLKRREERLSKFAGVVSHDLRNPLDVALGRAEVLPEIVDLDEETEFHVAEIHDSLKRMEHLIRDVLAVARHGETAVDLGSVDIETVARDAWSSVETGDAELRIAAIARITAHRSRLLRLFENLFRNATEHAGPDALVEVGLVESTTGVEGFYVADDGPGIPADQRGRIFDDGFSTTADGTGLGLSIVSEIARAHDWSVEIVEGIDGGARFEFTGVSLISEHDG